jgi:hypothetical protein
MAEVRDYTIKNGLGIRVLGTESCQVIRLQKGVWNEIGKKVPLPVDPTLLIWTNNGIPASTLAVALRVYELDHPAAPLRELLTGKWPKREVKRTKPRENPRLVAI